VGFGGWTQRRDREGRRIVTFTKLSLLDVQFCLLFCLFVAKPNDAPNAPPIRVIAPNQLAGQANPVMMLREQLRKRLTEQAMLPDGCSF
jgi:hypothetical protein